MAKYFARSGIIGITALALAGCAAPRLDLKDYSKPGIAQEQVLTQREKCYWEVGGAKYQANVDRAYRERQDKGIGAAILSPLAVLAPQPYASAVASTVEEAEKARKENQDDLDERMKICMKEKGF